MKTEAKCTTNWTSIFLLTKQELLMWQSTELYHNNKMEVLITKYE